MGYRHANQSSARHSASLAWQLVLAVDDSRALKHNTGEGGGRVPARRGLCQDFCQFASKQPPLGSFPSSRSVGRLPKMRLCTHRSARHALMFYIYPQQQQVRKTRASHRHRSPQRVGRGEKRTFAALSLTIDQPEKVITVSVDLLNWSLSLYMLNECSNE